MARPSPGWRAPAGSCCAGRVSWLGQQRRLIDTGRAEAAVQLADFRHAEHLYALGPVAGLDGEVTIIDSHPTISRIRGEGCSLQLDNGWDHGACYLAWAQVPQWQPPQLVPDHVRSMEDLADLIASLPSAGGSGVRHPTCFLLQGRPRSLSWHINVDRSEGRPISQEVFLRSKQAFGTPSGDVTIFGIHSDGHGGILMAPGARLHLHFTAADGQSSGHIDAIDPSGLALRLPR